MSGALLAKALGFAVLLAAAQAAQAAGADLGQLEKQPTNGTAIGMFAAFVVATLYRALKGRFDEHRRLARLVYPVWLYVSVTGVIVYLMLYQIYYTPR